MSRTFKQIILGALLIILLAVLVGPFLIPVPPLQGTYPPQTLADADSQFLEIQGLTLHVKTRGQGEPVFVLLHGFGASLYSWDAIMDPLSKLGRVIAFDRPAFGLSERPLDWEGQNPYSPESQTELVLGLMEHLNVDQAIMVGNSAGGTIAAQVALAYPDRVAALVLVDPAVYTGGGAPGWIRPLLSTPQMRRIGPLFVRQIERRGDELLTTAWHNPDNLTQEQIALYKKPLLVENWDKALWEFTLASRASNLPERLQDITLPVLVITGDDDRIVPTADSIRLAGELPNARLVVIENAGHVPHEERPEAFMNAVQEFLNTLR